MKSKKNIILLILCSLTGCLLLSLLFIWIYINQKLNQVNYVEDEELIEIDTVPHLEEVPTFHVTMTDSQKEKIAIIKKALINNFNNTNTNKQSDNNVYNVLLLGTDSRIPNKRGRSDVMIIVSINSKEKQITLTSLLRDIYVEIPGVGQNRLNAAYAFGGAPLLLKTIEGNFGISLDHYAIVDFYSFIDIIDTLGGITLTVSNDELDTLNKYIHEINRLLGSPSNLDEFTNGGTFLMNGKQALCYSRNRYLGKGDFTRTQRQQIVIEKIFNQAKELSLTKVNDLLDVILPMVTTNLTKNELLKKILKIPEYLKYDIQKWSIPVNGSYEEVTIRDMAVLNIDFEINKNKLFHKIYPKQEESGE